MAIGIVAKLTCKEGANAEFEAGFKKLQKVVKENEPDCLFYLLNKSRDDDTTYYVMESYANAKAIEFHGSYDEYRRTSKALGPLSGARPEITLMDQID